MALRPMRPELAFRDADPQLLTCFEIGSLDQLVKVGREQQRQAEFNQCGVTRCCLDDQGMASGVKVPQQKLPVVRLADRLAEQLGAVERSLLNEKGAQGAVLR